MLEKKRTKDPPYARRRESEEEETRAAAAADADLSSAVLTDEHHHRFRCEVAISEERRIELVKLELLLERKKNCLIQLLKTCFDILINTRGTPSLLTAKARALSTGKPPAHSVEKEKEKRDRETEES